MILAHDIGTSGDKASLYDDTGRLVAAVTAAYPTDYGSGGRVEQDPGDWWRAVGEASRSVVEKAGRSPADIAAVSLSGQMQGAVLLDGSGSPVRPALIWADTRAGAETVELIERVGLERGYAITGHRLNATYTLAKVMWVRRHEPAAWSRVATVAQAKDWIALRLSGRLATDPSDASGTNAYDQAVGTWSAELLAAAGLEAGHFPEIVPSTTILGPLTGEAARATGLRAGTPVVIGGGDGSCAALGAGLTSAASGINTYLGSSSWLSFVSDRPLHDAAMRTMTFNHVLPGRFVPIATMQAGGASLDWIVEALDGAAGAERHAARVAEAATVEAATEGLFFLPHLLGERSPHWDPLVRGAFVGLARRHGPAHLVRAVLEGVAFNLRTCLRALEALGAPAGPVDAIGGGARSETWLRIVADTWDRPIRRRSLVDEANGLGAAVLGGVAVGLFDSFDVAADLSSVETVFLPDPERHAAYEVAHARFEDAYRRLATWFTEVVP